ncbi:MAG: hypothetical protein COB76_02805 [Alphaproteobacteria bacterium]|nr:MAG: hypothetical protein COB76_02805 [Alphaproteobacteria bacterium]
MIYVSPFVKELKSLMDNDQGEEACADLLHHQNWRELYETPFSDRYHLVHEMICNIVVGKTITENDIFQNEMYSNAITFLMMSIPYEPLSNDEQNHAKDIAGFLSEEDCLGQSCVDNKLIKAKKIANFYLEQEGVVNNINMGVYDIKKTASAHIKDFFNNNAAFYYGSSLCDHENINDFEFFAPLLERNNIMFNVGYFKESDDFKIISTALHETRHYVQGERPTPIQEKQFATGVERRIVRYDDVLPYHISMTERQAYAFEGWLSDSVAGDSLRSEVQITCDNMLDKDRCESGLVDAIYDFNDCASQWRAERPPEVEYSPDRRPQLVA